MAPATGMRGASPPASQGLRLASKVALAALIAIAFATATPGRVRAEEAASLWSYSFYKTATYAALANASDFVLYMTVFGATTTASGLFVAANAATEGATYYVHELVWDRFGPSPSGSTVDTVELSLTKTVTFQVVSTVRGIALVYALTGNPWTAVGFGIASDVAHAAIYFGNEYGWATYGPPMPQ